MIFPPALRNNASEPRRGQIALLFLERVVSRSYRRSELEVVPTTCQKRSPLWKNAQKFSCPVRFCTRRSKCLCGWERQCPKSSAKRKGYGISCLTNYQILYCILEPQSEALIEEEAVAAAEEETKNRRVKAPSVACAVFQMLEAIRPVRSGRRSPRGWFAERDQLVVR